MKCFLKKLFGKPCEEEKKEENPQAEPLREEKENTESVSSSDQLSPESEFNNQGDQPVEQESSEDKEDFTATDELR